MNTLGRLPRKLCFLGLGYIGLPTAVISANHGFEVLGVDINPDIVKAVNDGQSILHEPELDVLFRKAVEDGKLTADVIPHPSEVYFIVVPTPFKRNHEPDISHVEAAVKSIAPLLREDNIVIIESTCPVGTTERMVRLINELRPDLSDRIDVAYCPERVLPGNIVRELIDNDRVIGGVTPRATARACELYASFVKGALHGTDARTAEMCKLTENASRDVQIAFANELSMICDKAGIDVRELISLANRHPRVNILQPGCGVGGHCIAVDPYFLTSDYPRESRLIATARELNNYKSFWCVERIQSRIEDFRRHHDRSPVVALMGLAFKPDIDDLRESPALYIANKVMETMEGKAEFLVSEPNIDDSSEFALTDWRSAFDRADIAVLLVAHREFRALAANRRDNDKILTFCYFP